MLATTWYLIIAGLWTGYLVLEGFDFGVGALLPVIGRDDTGRQVLINTIGPVWDGNEVWVITAGGATFAAFPDWYATLFSGLYLPLLLILLALIGRGVALEYRGKRDDPAWRRRVDWTIVAGSAVPAVLWGIALSTTVHGLPLTARHDYTGGVVGLLTPYSILGGLTTAALCLTHGAVFLGLRTTQQLRDRARRLAIRIGPVALPVLVAYLAWTVAQRPRPAALVTAVLATLALAATLALTRAGRDGWAFAASAVAIGLTVITLFAAAYPNVLPSTTGTGGLTVQNAAAGRYPLKIMTWLAGFAAPLVLAYQTWTYWVFRRRVRPGDISAH